MTFDISPFRIEFYDQVFALWQQCEGIGLSEADAREHIQTYLERNPGMSFIATSGNAVIGAVLCGHDGRRGFIHHLAVHSAYRRQGLARQLIERCLAELAEVGIQKCHIFILNTNSQGIEFWRRTGWFLRTDISLMSKNIEPREKKKKR